MIEELKEKGCDCGLCSHGKTNGWIAPVVKCDKWTRDEMPILPYMYYNEKYPGTTCEFFHYRYEKSYKNYGEWGKDIFKVIEEIVDETLSDKL